MSKLNGVAFMRGAIAQKKLATETDNPHKTGGKKYRSWIVGWESAEYIERKGLQELLDLSKEKHLEDFEETS